MKKTLFYTDDATLHQLKKDFNELKPLLNELKSNYNSLGIGKMTNEIYHELIQKGISKTWEKYNSLIEKDLDNTKVVNPQLRQMLKKNVFDPIELLDKKVSIIKNYKPKRLEYQNTGKRDYLKATDINFSKDNFTLDQDSIIKIRDKYCNTYITGDTEHELLEKFENLKNSYLELKEFVLKNNFTRESGFRMNNLKDFFIEGDGSGIINSIENGNSLNLEINKPLFIGLLNLKKYKEEWST